MAKPAAYPETVLWRRRVATACVVIAAHMALLVSFQARSRPAPGRPPAGQGGVSLSIVMWKRPSPTPAPIIAPPSSPQRPQASPSPPPDPASSEPIQHPEDLGLPAPRTDLEPIPVGDAPRASTPTAMAGDAAPDDPCHFAQGLQAALQSDQTALHALTLIPRDAKSLANAIMVWNGQWVAVDALDGDASFEPVRAAIVQGLGASSVECLARVNSGPLFIIVTVWPETTVLALGSGQWRAVDLIAQPTGVGSAPTAGPALNRRHRAGAER